MQRGGVRRTVETKNSMGKERKKWGKNNKFFDKLV
jgi:hypothetical protein